MRVLIAPLGGALTTMLCLFLVQRFGLTISAEQQAEIGGYVTALLTGLSLAVYGVVNKLIARKFNPANVAKMPASEALAEGRADQGVA